MSEFNPENRFDDQYWKLGFIYYNPDDPKVLLPNVRAWDGRLILPGFGLGCFYWGSLQLPIPLGILP